jgi:hypothetical protein
VEQARQSALNESQHHLEKFSFKLNSSRFAPTNLNSNNNNNTSVNNQYREDNILNESFEEEEQDNN